MYGVSLLEFRGDKVVRERIYVMDGWGAPGWRAPLAVGYPGRSTHPSTAARSARRMRPGSDREAFDGLSRDLGDQVEVLVAMGGRPGRRSPRSPRASLAEYPTSKRVTVATRTRPHWIRSAHVAASALSPSWASADLSISQPGPGPAPLTTTLGA